MLNIGNLPKRNNESGTFPVYYSKTFTDFEKFSALFWIALCVVILVCQVSGHNLRNNYRILSEQ